MDYLIFNEDELPMASIVANKVSAEFGPLVFRLPFFGVFMLGSAHSKRKQLFAAPFHLTATLRQLGTDSASRCGDPHRHAAIVTWLPGQAFAE